MKRIVTLFAAIALSFPLFGQQTITLSNDNVKLVFDQGGNEFRIRSFEMGGRELLASGGSNTPVWDLVMQGPQGETPNMKPRWTYYDGGVLSEDGTKATFTWRVVMKREAIWPVKVTVSLKPGDELPSWDISMDMPSGWKVTDLEFPRLSVLRPEGVKGIMSVGFGAEYPIGDMIQSRYPSCTGALQLILAHNPEGTFFFSSRDKSASMKLLQIRSEGKNITFVQKVVTSWGWNEDDGDKVSFRLPWTTVFGYNPGPWEETVTKWYTPFTYETEWGSKKLSEREIPQWIKDADIWLRPQDVTETQKALVKKALDYYGKGVGLHWYYWHNHPFDSYYPEYFPAKDGFVEAVKDAQARGAHVTPYINGRLWDSATDSYIAEEGYKSSCRKQDGTMYTEIYSSKVINTVSCPSSEIWQNVLKNLNKRILEELHTDGVYMDQIGAAASEACYSTEHGHIPGGGGWWPAAYRQVLTDMRETVYRPGQAMTTEENAECYIDLFDMMLVVNGPHTPTVHMVPLYPLVYSDRSIYSGFTYIPWKINDGSFVFLTAKSLLWGSQLGWINPELLFKDGNRREIEFLKTMGEFRKKQHDLFLGGKFVREFIPGGDNPEVDIPNYQRTPVVIGSEWVSVKGKKAVLLVNIDSVQHTVTLGDGRSVTLKPYSAKRI